MQRIKPILVQSSSQLIVAWVAHLHLIDCDITDRPDTDSFLDTEECRQAFAKNPLASSKLFIDTFRTHYLAWKRLANDDKVDAYLIIDTNTAPAGSRPPQRHFNEWASSIAPLLTDYGALFFDKDFTTSYTIQLFSPLFDHHSYVITKECARQAIQAFDNFGAHDTIFRLIAHTSGAACAPIAIPSFLSRDTSSSTSDTTVPLGCAPHESLAAVMHSFVFLPGLDQFSNDLACVTPNVIQNAEESFHSVHSVAFNTFGYHKHTITSFSRPDIMGPHDGIYVKYSWVDKVARGTIELCPDSAWTRDDAIECIANASRLTSTTHPTRFSSDWHTGNIHNWIQTIPQMLCTTNLHILEIGSFEGRSSLWFANNALQGSQARLDCIDTWEGSVENKVEECSLWDTFQLNMQPFLDKTVFTYRGFSQDVLLNQLRRPDGRLPTYDVIYIDGSHFAKDCLVDAVISFEMLKTGGHIIFDDYQWGDKFPDHYRPRMAIDAFTSVYKDRFQTLLAGHQLIGQKVDDKWLYDRDAFQRVYGSLE